MRLTSSGQDPEPFRQALAREGGFCRRVRVAMATVAFPCWAFPAGRVARKCCCTQLASEGNSSPGDVPAIPLDVKYDKAIGTPDESVSPVGR